MKIGIKLAIFSWVGSTPVWKHWLTICVISWWIKVIVPLSHLVDISSYPLLHLGFNVYVSSITWKDSTGSMNIIFILGFARYCVYVLFALGAFWEVCNCIFIKWCLHSTSTVIFRLFIQSDSGNFDLSFDLSSASLFIGFLTHSM